MTLSMLELAIAALQNDALQTQRRQLNSSSTETYVYNMHFREKSEIKSFTDEDYFIINSCFHVSEIYMPEAAFWNQNKISEIMKESHFFIFLFLLLADQQNHRASLRRR